MNLGDLVNPKSSWLLIYGSSLLYQFLGLLVEMNSAATAMKARYEYLKFGEAEDSVRNFSSGKEAAMQKHALNGVGAALIIGTDSLIKELQNSNPNPRRDDENPKRPKIRGQNWEELIRAAGNYVRHGDEWRMIYREFCVGLGVPEFSLQDRPELIGQFVIFLKDKRVQAFKSIKVLYDTGIPLDAFLFNGNRVWDMADFLLLTEVEASMKLMRQLLETFYDRPIKKSENLSQ